MQVELATDILFYRQAELQPLYDAWVRTAVHAVKADTVATFPRIADFIVTVTGDKHVNRSDRCAPSVSLHTDAMSLQAVMDRHIRAKLWTFVSTPWRPGEQGARKGNPDILRSTSTVQTLRWHPSTPCSEDR